MSHYVTWGSPECQFDNRNVLFPLTGRLEGLASNEQPMSCCKWNRAAEHGEAFWVSQLVNSRFTDWLSTTSRTINHELLHFYFLIPESRDLWITISGSGSGFFVALKTGTEPYDPGTWNLNLIKPGWWGSKLVHAHSMSHVWKCGVLTGI